MKTVIVISVYLILLLFLAVISGRLFKGTSRDYFVASNTIGPFMLLMSVFGTTMTAFALVGSTGEAYKAGIGVYGMLASWSGLIHAAVFFLIGIKVWTYGKRYGYVTQCQYFRDRFESNLVGTLLFPILVALIIPYLLIGLLATGSVVKALTRGAFPDFFVDYGGGIPPPLSIAVICLVVLTYIFFGGIRATAWANTLQTIIFMILGLVAFFAIGNALGGLEKATSMAKPERLIRGAEISQAQFFTYMFVPLSVGMFPHLFQHWLTAKSAKAFKLTVVAHPICIMVVWVPCILIGIWATGAMYKGNLVVPPKHAPNTELALMVIKLTGPWLAAFLSIGILAAIMSSLDSQFLCLGTMFTHDVVLHHFGKDHFSDKQKIWLARGFIILIVLITYGFTFFEVRRVFTLGVWCFSGFASLFPIIFASIYWKKTTKAGVIASIVATTVVWFILFYFSKFGLDRKYLFPLGPWKIMPVAVMFFASTLSLILVSLFTSPPREETIKKFFKPAKGIQ